MSSQSQKSSSIGPSRRRRSSRFLSATADAHPYARTVSGPADRSYTPDGSYSEFGSALNSSRAENRLDVPSTPTASSSGIGGFLKRGLGWFSASKAPKADRVPALSRSKSSFDMSAHNHNSGNVSVDELRSGIPQSRTLSSLRSANSIFPGAPPPGSPHLSPSTSFSTLAPQSPSHPQSSRAHSPSGASSVGRARTSHSTLNLRSYADGQRQRSRAASPSYSYRSPSPFLGGAPIRSSASDVFRAPLSPPSNSHISSQSPFRRSPVGPNLQDLSLRSPSPFRPPPSAGSKRAFTDRDSPPPPSVSSSTAGIFSVQPKKQMVWDPVYGFTSTENIARETNAAKPKPRTEVERVLGILDGLRESQTPVFRDKLRMPANVPVPASSRSDAGTENSKQFAISPHARRKRQETRGRSRNALSATLRNRHEAQRDPFTSESVVTSPTLSAQSAGDINNDDVLSGNESQVLSPNSKKKRETRSSKKEASQDTSGLDEHTPRRSKRLAKTSNDDDTKNSEPKANPKSPKGIKSPTSKRKTLTRADARINGEKSSKPHKPSFSAVDDDENSEEEDEPKQKIKMPDLSKPTSTSSEEVNKNSFGTTKGLSLPRNPPTFSTSFTSSAFTGGIQNSSKEVEKSSDTRSVTSDDDSRPATPSPMFSFQKLPDEPIAITLPQPAQPAVTASNTPKPEITVDTSQKVSEIPTSTSSGSDRIAPPPSMFANLHKPTRPSPLAFETKPTSSPSSSSGSPSKTDVEDNNTADAPASPLAAKIAGEQDKKSTFATSFTATTTPSTVPSLFAPPNSSSTAKKEDLFKPANTAAEKNSPFTGLSKPAETKPAESPSLFSRMGSVPTSQPTGSLFGAPSTSQTAAPSSAAPSIFGNPIQPSQQASTESKSAPVSLFSATPSNKIEPPKSLFGAPPKTTESEAPKASLFGVPSKTSESEAAKVSLFETQPKSPFTGFGAKPNTEASTTAAPVQATSPPAASPFGGLSALSNTKAASSTLPFSFGASASSTQPEPPSKPLSFSFGTSQTENKSPAAATNIQSPFSIVHSNATNASSNAAPSEFGQQPSSKPSFSFGSTSTSTSTSEPAAPAFGVNQATNTTSSFFGQSASASTSAAPSAPSFGSGFQSQPQSTPTSPFGTSSGPTPSAFNFGVSSPSATPASTPFGFGQSNANTSGFGQANDNKPAVAFGGFGNNTSSAPTTPSASPSFSFGAAASQPAQQQPAGNSFSFSAPGQSNNAMNANPTGGQLFNLGSSSTDDISKRQIKPLRRRRN